MRSAASSYFNSADHLASQPRKTIYLCGFVPRHREDWRWGWLILGNDEMMKVVPVFALLDKAKPPASHLGTTLVYF
jgi:hypothetical protein